MDKLEILKFIEGLKIHTKSPIALKETHISWIILSADQVIKIKKPVKFNFLDFSTLERRKHFCENELYINQVAAPHIYLRVVPIYKNDNLFSLENNEGNIVDYGIVMNKMDSERQMNLLLEKGHISGEDISNLAREIIRFHQSAEIITSPKSWKQVQNDFNDLRSIEPILNTHLGERYSHKIESLILQTGAFMSKHAQRFRERQEAGMIRDVHGDLHSGNIFLLNNPVLFDRLEFNDELRKIDLLDDIAFLGMDLNFWSRPDLERIFLHEYLSQFPIIRTDQDVLLYYFYKLYRANIRLKVHALKLDQLVEQSQEYEMQLLKINRYFHLMEHYMKHMAETDHIRDFPSNIKAINHLYKSLK